MLHAQPSVFLGDKGELAKEVTCLAHSGRRERTQSEKDPIIFTNLRMSNAMRRTWRTHLVLSRISVGHGTDRRLVAIVWHRMIRFKTSILVDRARRLF